MTELTADAIAVQMATERIRQERVTFEQLKSQEEKWFLLRLRMGYTAVVILAVVAMIGGYIVLQPEKFSDATVTAASAALFVDVLATMAAIWKIVLRPDSMERLKPVTSSPDWDRIGRQGSIGE